MNKLILTACAAMTGTLGIAQDKIPVRMTVTVEASHGKEIPELRREDVMVFQGKERLPVTGWTSLTGGHAGLELFILIDDGSDMRLGGQYGDVREFINSQPASTLVGIGYMRADTADIVQNLTSDHAKAAHALRLPLGGIAAGASPYLALSDLIKKWATCCVRREVLLISNGVDPLSGFGPTNPFLDIAIEQAQRAGIIVYAIYTPRAGHAGHSFFQINWGQNHLAQLTEQTGGESYMLGSGPPVSFEPYLRDLAEHLAHQYLVSFLAKPLSKPDLSPVRFSTEVPHAEIVAAPKMYLLPEPPPTGER